MFVFVRASAFFFLRMRLFAAQPINHRRNRREPFAPSPPKRSDRATTTTTEKYTFYL